MTTVHYAIGDIHGRDDLLERMHLRIVAHRVQHHADADAVLVYVGDYVDRGPASREVIDRVMAGLDGFRSVALKGNLDTTALVESASAERFVARIGGDAPPAIATHFDFQNWPLYGALTGVEDDRGAGARSLDAGRDFFLAAIRTTKLFLDHALTGDSTGLPILEGSAPLPGIDPDWVELTRFPGR